jgi:membrane protease YdiL (CAAX protease family)
MKALFKNIGWVFLEVLLFSIAFIVLLAVQWKAINFLYHDTTQPWEYGNLNESTNPYRLTMLSFLPILLAGIGSALLIHTVIFKRSVSALGFRWDQAGSLFGRGWLMSLIMIAPGFLLLWITGQLKLLSPTWSFSYFIGFILFFFIQSTGEEVMTRAILIPTIEKRLGILIAVIISGSFFAFLHVWNDHFSWIGFMNILLGGAIMAILFVVYRNLWICMGYHAGWNFIQGSLFDFNVSGMDVYSFIQWTPVGYPRLTGADFGYEGSVLAILLQGILLAYLIRNHKSILMQPKPMPISDEVLATDIHNTIPTPLFTLDRETIHPTPSTQEPGSN